MVAINRLNQVQTLDDDDLSVIWQNSSGRTRSITVANLRKFIQSTDPNSDAFVKAELIGDELVLTSHDEVETKININLLPSHSVTELQDMPDNLIAGQYLKVKDDGSGFILTPSSEISAEITVQAGDGPASEADVLKFTGNSNLSVEDKVATIESGIMIDGHFITKIYTESDLDVLIEDDEATISVNNKVSPWPIEIVGIGDSPKVIDKVEQLGVEYQFGASSMFTQSVHLYHVGLPEGAQIKVTVVDVEKDSKPIDVFQLSAGGDLRWPVITPTVFTLRSGLWRVEESSQLLHVANSTTFDGDGAEKKIVHGLAADPSSLITMEVNDQGVLVIGAGGSIENPVVKTIGIDTNGSGQPNFTASIHQDGELHTVIDATRELRVNYKDTGTGTTTTVMGIDNNQAQFLVPIMQGNDAVALAKDIPNTGNFIQKHTNAELNKLFAAYQGKYGENRVHHPASIYQDVNGWTQLEFTGNMLFKPRGKDTGTLGEKVLEIRSSKLVAHKETELLANTTYSGDTSQPKNPVTREALDAEPQKEWFSVASGTLVTDGSRPTGDTGVEGELAVWHNVTSDSTTDPANELKIVFDGAYEKVDGFSKPVRFRLSQQGGSRNQYWTVGDNGWQTEGNVWHLSAKKVTGDNLVVGIDTIVQASALFLADVSEEINEKIAADKAKGEWVGGVYKDTINDDGNPEDEFTCNNPKHWLEYRKTTFQGDYALTVRQGDTPISSEIVIHLHPSSGMASTQFRVVTNDGKETIKTVRTGEKWRFFLRKGTWPYYERIDDGTTGGSEYDLTFRDADVLDKVQSIGFEEANGGVTQIDAVEDIKYQVSDVPARLHNEGTVNIIMDSSKPIGAFQVDNTCNYYGDYPELVVMLYVEGSGTSLGGFRVPYGLGATVKYNLDNKTVNNYKQGYWTWNLSVVDWSIVKKVAHAGILDKVDVSSFDDDETYIKPLKKSFENKDLVSIPVELPVGFDIIVSSVICKVNGRLRKQPFEYQYESGILRVHLNEVCTGVIIAELIK